MGKLAGRDTRRKFLDVNEMQLFASFPKFQLFLLRHENSALPRRASSGWGISGSRAVRARLGSTGPSASPVERGDDRREEVSFELSEGCTFQQIWKDS